MSGESCKFRVDISYGSGVIPEKPRGGGRDKPPQAVKG